VQWTWVTYCTALLRKAGAFLSLSSQHGYFLSHSCTNISDHCALSKIMVDEMAAEKLEVPKLGRRVQDTPHTS
jgi:hypothetical protein